MENAKWAEIDKCDWMDGCNAKVTHVTFINTPLKEHWPYVIGTCRKHKDADDFPKMTLAKFKKAVSSMSCSNDEELAMAVCKKVDPTLMKA